MSELAIQLFPLESESSDELVNDELESNTAHLQPLSYHQVHSLNSPQYSGGGGGGGGRRGKDSSYWMIYMI